MNTKNILLKLVLICLLSITYVSLFSQNRLVYPIIFVHGLAGNETYFSTPLEYLRDHDNLGEINVFDVVLNADDNFESALMSEDVKWEDFEFDGDLIYCGRRNYTDSQDDYVDYWTGANLFVVNFQEEKIKGASGLLNDYFDQGNEAAIYKQGYALNKVIQNVLDYTGAEKVILVGHSMGGLCIREYLQRTDEFGVHVNWIDPSSPDGHKVARVATYGTPHLGSTTSPDPTKSEIPTATGVSEANRDLLWEYDEYTFCEEFPQGIYLFGGNENCIASEGGLFGNATFDNVDINCNGSQTDDIIGINEGFDSYTYNTNMPLPLNIEYTYMTSVWADWGESFAGDGAVAIQRQWLHDGDVPTPIGIADTTLNNIDHLSESHDHVTIIRGIDEPEHFEMAFRLVPDFSVIGYITFQQNYETSDVDIYKINCGENSHFGFVINGESSGVNSVAFYNQDETLISSQDIDGSSDTIYVEVPQAATEIYVKITGTATETTWENPYTQKMFPADFTNNNSISAESDIVLFPNPSTGFLFYETSANFNPDIIQVINNEAQIVYELQNPSTQKIDLSFLKNGVYFIRFYSDSKLTVKQFVILN